MAAVSVWIGGRLVAGAPSVPGPIPRDLPFEEVTFSSASGSVIRAWYARGREGDGAVVLMHGTLGSRATLVPRARFLAQTGHAVLLFDFQAHGASPGTHVTFGYLESRDVRAAIRYMRARLPSERLGGIGISLGGMAALVGPQPVGFDALVLEAVAPTLAGAVENRIRIRLGPLAPVLAPLLLVQTRPRLGFTPQDVRPIVGIAEVAAPVLVVAGTEDRHTTLAESERLFEAARPPREFWRVAGAGHVDFHAYATDEYEDRILTFFDPHLRRRSAASRW